MPVQLLNEQTNQIVTLSNEEALVALQSGQFSGRETDTIPMYSPTGNVVEVVIPNLKNKLLQGYRVQTEGQATSIEEREQFEGRTISSFLAGAARGPSFGISDAILTGTGVVSPETLQGLKEYNRGVSSIGEIGGIAGSLLIPGVAPFKAGGGLVRGVGRLGLGAERAVTGALKAKAGTGLAGRLLTKGVGVGSGAAVEGGFYGGGQLLSDVVLGDADLTAENALRYLGTGSVLAGGIGGTIGLSQVALPAALSRVKSSLVKMRPADEKSLLSHVWNKSMVPAAQRLSTKPRDLVEDFVSMTPEAARRRSLASVSTEEQNKKIYDFFKRMEDFSDEVVDQKNIAYSGRKVLIEKLIDDVPIGQGIMGTRRVVMDIDDRIAGFKANPAKYGLDADFSELKKLRDTLEISMNKARKGKIKTGRLFDDINDVRRNLGHLNEEVYGKGSPSQREIAKQMRDVYRNIRGYMDDTANFGPAAKIVSDMDTAISEFFDAKKAFQISFGKEKLNIRRFNASMKRLGSPEGAEIENVIDDYVSRSTNLIEIFEHSLQEEQLLNKGLVQKISRDLIKNKSEMREIVSARRGMRELLYGARGAGKTIVEKVSGGIGGGVGGTLGAIWGGMGGAVGGAIAGLKISEGFSRLMTNPGKTAELMHSLGQFNSQNKSIIRKSIENFVKGTGKVKEISRPLSWNILSQISIDGQKKPKNEIEGFKRVHDRLAQIQANPLSIVDMAQVSGMEEIPQVQMALTAKIQNIVNFLMSKIPTDPMSEYTAIPSFREWQPGDFELKKFSTYLAYVNDPLLILKDIEKGNVSPESIEAVRFAFPELFAQIQDEVLSNLTELRENLPYDKRLTLSQILDVPLEDSLHPEHYQGLQDTFIEEGISEESLLQDMMDKNSKPVQLDLAKQEKTKPEELAEIG